MYCFENSVVDIHSALILFRNGYPHEVAEYYWVMGPADDYPIKLGWNLYSKAYLKEINFDIIDLKIRCYAAPNSEEIFLWKLKGSY
jgi:hypothetical protein